MMPVPSWAQLLAEAALKGSLLIAAGGAAALLCRRSSAAVRHAAWTTAIAGALLVGPLALVLPPVRVPAPAPVAGALALFSPHEAPPVNVPRGVEARPPAAPAASPARAGRRPFRPPLLLLWAAGVFAFSCSFLGAGLRLARISRRASAVADSSIDRLAMAAAAQLGVAPARVRLRWSDREITPMTWGCLRPVLILPASCRNWESERLRQVLVHELGHIRRWDVLTQALGSAACVLYWFNPLVWLAARQMMVERERACDDLVLESGAKPSSYAHELLEIARSLGARWTAASVSPAMARRSQISGRLLAVLESGRSRRPLGGRGALLAAVGGAAVVLPLAALWTAVSVPAMPIPIAQVETLEDPAIDPADLKAISAIYDQWRAAVRRGDAQAIARFYTADALLVVEGRAPASGRPEVAAFFQDLFNAGMADVEIRSDEFYKVGEMLCELGRSEGLARAGPVMSSSRYMTLWSREDGKWRVHRDFLSR